MGHPKKNLSIYCNIIKNSQQADNKLSIEYSVFIKACLLAAGDFLKCYIVEHHTVFMYGIGFSMDLIPCNTGCIVVS